MSLQVLNMDERQFGLFEQTHEVYLELSNYCTLAHVHHKCPIHLMQRKRNILPTRIVLHVLETLARYDFSGRISFHTYNEPLMDPRLFKFVRLARKMCPASNIYICTNGYCLTQEMIDELVSAGVTSFHISAYTPDDEEKFSQMRWPVEAGVQLMILDERMDLYEAPENDLNTPCFAPLSELIVTAGGLISLCCLDWKRQYCFGDLNTQKLEQIMTGEKIHKVYSKLSNGDRCLPLCKRCGWSRGKGEPACHSSTANKMPLPEPVSIARSSGGQVTMDIVQDLSEFTGLDAEQASRLVRYNDYPRRDEFRDVITTEGGESWLHRSSRYAIFESAKRSSTLDDAVKHLIPSSGRVWGFGVGAGNISLALAAQGHSVCCTELGSLQTDFVTFRSHKYGLPVEIIHPWQPKPVERFDSVLVLNALEYFTDYDRILSELCNSVKPGGMMWDVSAFAASTPEAMGRTQDMHDYRRLLSRSGFQRIYGCCQGRLWRKVGKCGPDTLGTEVSSQVSGYIAQILPDLADCKEQVVHMAVRGFEEMALGDFALAVDYLDEACRLKSELASPRLYGSISTMAGNRLLQLQEVLGNAMAPHTGEEQAFMKGLDTYINAVRHTSAGMRLLARGDIGAAIAEFDAALALCDAVPGLSYAKAVALARLGKFGSAQYACTQELQVQPHHKGTLDLLAKLEAVLKTVESGDSSKAVSTSTVQ